MDEGYAGWTNRETWATGLWIGNDEGLYRWVRRILTRPNASFNDKVHNLREFFIDICSNAAEQGNKEALYMCQDIGSLWRVNWEEIARAYLEE